MAWREQRLLALAAGGRAREGRRMRPAARLPGVGGGASAGAALALRCKSPTLFCAASRVGATEILWARPFDLGHACGAMVSPGLRKRWHRSTPNVMDWPKVATGDSWLASNTTTALFGAHLLCMLPSTLCHGRPGSTCPGQCPAPPVRIPARNRWHLQSFHQRRTSPSRIPWPPL